ncbi:MAG: SpoVR family protein [Nitrospinota bacterium]
MSLSPELRRWQQRVEEAARGFGLDFCEIIFEVVDYERMNAVAAYGGFPTRFPHWRFGMAYNELSKGHAYGLRKIYEMVINNEPCYAHLLESNNLTDQKMVMAHVCAHCDFFRNNYAFAKTDRKMVDEMANHATRIRKYMDRHGEAAVEEFIDRCLSVEDLIDPHAPFVRRRREPPRDSFEEEAAPPAPARFESKDYMEEYVNPPEFLEEQRRQLDEEEEQRRRRFPEEPERDVLLFLIEHGQLENWQRDILSVIREESIYYASQWQTKMMNEGWATYWHSKILTGQGEAPPLLEDSELVHYADHHSGTVGGRPGVVNPYKLGLELFRNVEERWNKGRFGKEYEECEDLVARKNWDMQLGMGRQKIFEVRKLYNDVTFIDTFLTREFCEEQGLFVFRYNRKTRRYEVAERDFEAVRRQLLFSITNAGRPIVRVLDGNCHNRGELLLEHQHEGVDLRLDYAREALQRVQELWGRPVHLGTIVEGRPRRFSFDGHEHHETDAR